MDLGLGGKTVVITGGSGGIGRTLVLEFAREGANVVSASRDMEKNNAIVEEASELGLTGQVMAQFCDVTDRSSVDAMVAAAHARFGPVDVLVNNAGAVFHPSPLEDMTSEARQWEVSLNIDGVVNCCQAVAKDMLSRRQGSIVNISSTGSLVHESAKLFANYGGTKGYVNAFSMALAAEWGDRKVRVNTIAPGWIVPHDAEKLPSSSFWNRFPDIVGTPEQAAKTLSEGATFNMSAIPLQRAGRPEDVAYCALFFASDVSSYMTGQMLSPSGGSWMF